MRLRMDSAFTGPGRGRKKNLKGVQGRMNEEDIYVVRCKAFAALELMLDIMHSTRTLTQVDGESMIIFACVTEATMRQLMLSPDTPEDVKKMQKPPEEYRGSITMLSVADKLGLPRETVRRKIKALIDKKILVEHDGRIRSRPYVMSPRGQRAASDIFDAVKRYTDRLHQLGVAAPGDDAAEVGAP